MTPVEVLIKFTKRCAIRPLSSLAQPEQKELKKELGKALADILSSLVGEAGTPLREALEKTNLEIQKESFAEDIISENLNYISVIYQRTKSEKFAKKATELLAFSNKYKQLIDEWRSLEESLKKKIETMTPEEKQQADLTTFQKIGVFYVLEYTLQVSYDLARAKSEKTKEKILYQGIKNPEGENIPGLIPLLDSFRREFCYNLTDPKLKKSCLITTYDFDDVVATKNIDKIEAALKKYNLNLLNILQAGGLKIYRPTIYKTFGENIPISEVVSQLQKL